jgi:N-ethylmaleimide reductase
MTTAFEAIVLGGKHPANRVVTAPMTRSRASGPGAEPTEPPATYYAQRAATGSAR